MTRANLVYADDDLLDGAGRRHSPHFKPSWNPDLFQHHDFASGASIIRAAAPVLATLPEHRWVEALVRNAATTGTAAVRLPCVLHHRKQRPAPLVPGKPAELNPNHTPSVTVIIPTRNQAQLLRNCMEGVRRTASPRINVIVVDNDSDDPETLAYLRAIALTGTTVLPLPGPFNYSALNNAAARQAEGDLLCFLNNDIETLDGDWLDLMARQAIRPEIGAVGARLLYPNGTIQHAGVIIGVGGGAGHGHRFQRPRDTGYFDRASLPQQVSAVTAACLVVERRKFLAVGGFEEEDFPVAFNDVDLCFKLNARGWRSFYEPRATLIHHESMSRGRDRTKAGRTRFAGELAALKRKWRTDKEGDPFHHPHLSLLCEQFTIAI